VHLSTPVWVVVAVDTTRAAVDQVEREAQQAPGESQPAQTTLPLLRAAAADGQTVSSPTEKTVYLLLEQAQHVKMAKILLAWMNRKESWEGAAGWRRDMPVRLHADSPVSHTGSSSKGASFRHCRHGRGFHDASCGSSASRGRGQG
jgi:hypothetical protein